ncbi:MAG TPA: hypothetical protein VGR57_06055, partial [Ktedonobacterales bacterium]|nr:hypothetical protein [Ktedonobacterales bacterium]
MEGPPLSTPDDPPSHDGLTTVALEAALAARTPRRHLLARSALVMGALVVVLGALLRGPLPLPHWSLAAAAPTPGAHSRFATSQWSNFTGQTAATGPVNIYSNVSFGAVTLNGKRLAGSPPLSVSALAPGANTLTLDAPPFPKVTCAVYATGAPDDGSDAYRATGPCSVYGAGGRVNIIVLLTGATLPPTVAARALSTLRVAVSQLPTEYADVPVGEYYATGIDAHGAITYARATQPLGAHLDYAPFTGRVTAGGTARVAAPGAGAPCAELQCGGTTFTDLVGASAWLVSEPLLLRMRFQGQDGTLLGTLTLPGAVPQPFALAYRTDGTWQTVNLSARFLQPLVDQCVTGASLLWTQLQAAHGSGNGGLLGSTSGSLVGCQITAAVAGASAGTFIWRFGV